MNVYLYSLMDNEFVILRVKFDFYFYLESQEQSNEAMIMKCTNLIQEDNKNSDNDNQEDSKTKKKKERKKNHHVFFFFSK